MTVVQHRGGGGTDPFLAPGAAALGVQVDPLGGPLPASPEGRGPTGFTAALDASSLKVPLFQGCTNKSSWTNHQC